MPVTPDQFGKALITSGLMTADEVKALWAALPTGERPKDGEAFASLLVKQDKLTEFQAQELLSGLGTPLVLGDYVLLAKIGAGGMGQVFKARHRHMDRLVAIKLLPAALTKDDATVKRFQREVKAAAKLSHPNIVVALDARVERGVWCLVMECVEGRDLTALLKQRGPLPVDEACDYILQAARGLAYAHGKGVVHRDIKPANLLLDNEGTVKILDMGLARFDASDDAADHQLTGAGQMMGTIDYMAPEQSLDTHAADARSDIYSLGCSLYRLLTGASVFARGTIAKKLVAHMHAPVPSLCAHRAEIPAEIDRIFQKMLAKKPEDRYQQAAELVADLEAWKSSLLAPGESPGGSSLTNTQKSELTNYLDALLPPVSVIAAVQPKVHTVARTEQTMAKVGPEIGTDPNSQVRLAIPVASAASPVASARGVVRIGKKRPPLLWIAAGIGAVVLSGFLGALLLGLWVIIRDKDGKEVARVQVPEGGTATAQAQPLPRTVPAPATTETIPAPTTTVPAPTTTVSAPTTTVPAVPGPPPQVPTTKATSIPSTDSPAVAPSVNGAAPAIAKAPFDTVTAKKHQEAWARHLAIRVENTNSVGIKLVLIPPGQFLMGRRPDESDRLPPNGLYQEPLATQHQVTLTRPYLVGVTEVTQRQWREVVGSEPWKGQSRGKIGDEYPATYTTKDGTADFCRRLSQQEGVTYRLPTEAEWEFACRAGTETIHFFGDDRSNLRDYAWTVVAQTGDLQLVATKKPNPWGLYDIYGNLWEWVADGPSAHPSQAVVDPLVQPADRLSIIRGSCFRSLLVREFSSGARHTWPGSLASDEKGFRIVCEVDAAARKAWAVPNATTEPASPPVMWPVDAVSFGSKRFKLYAQHTGWHVARKKCEELGGRLAEARSKEENEFLVTLALGKEPDGIWLGATDEAQEGRWVWGDGAPLTYTSWDKEGAQPNNVGNDGEHYLMLLITKNAGKWWDQPAVSGLGLPRGWKVGYVCEWDDPTKATTPQPAASGTK